MRYGKKAICLLLAALLSASALAGCGGQAEENGERGVALRACVCAPIASLDPAMNDDPAATSVFHAIFENLMRVREDADGTRVLTPAVAKEYEVVENFDGTVDYVFTLRSSARWSDGVRVKAGDFVYAWRRLVNPATGSPNAALLSMVSGYAAARETGDATRLAVRADGSNRFCVTLAAPCPYFLSDVCAAVATMPLRSDAAGMNPDWASSGRPLCNGPFRVSVWAKKESLYLRRNEEYYDSRAVTLDSLRFVFTDTAEQAARHYEDGLADYISPAPDGAEGAERAPLRGVTSVLYNHMSDVFSDAHVRRAFDLALDRAAIAAAVGGGRTAATGLVPHGVGNADAADEMDFRAAGGELIAVDEEGYAARCAAAGDELRKSGYQVGLDFPETVCIYAQEDAGSAAAAEAAAGIWREKLNVSVRAEGLPREEFDSRVAAGGYDLAVDAFGAPWGDALDYLAPYAGLDGDNALHYVSKPYDLLIGVAETSRDSAARAAILHDAEALLLEETALSPLWFSGTTYLLREGFTGVVHDARGSAYFDAAAWTEPAG